MSLRTIVEEKLLFLLNTIRHANSEILCALQILLYYIHAINYAAQRAKPHPLIG